mmetsp:Transcript_44312/g.79500  ORF Transcript_44312/g.79500 Transcript_44312/m.79500 type:complete len:295 (-) Transcript_44312:1479-2363(-)
MNANVECFQFAPRPSAPNKSRVPWQTRRRQYAGMDMDHTGKVIKAGAIQPERSSEYQSSYSAKEANRRSNSSGPCAIRSDIADCVPGAYKNMSGEEYEKTFPVQQRARCRRLLQYANESNLGPEIVPKAGRSRSTPTQRRAIVLPSSGGGDVAPRNGGSKRMFPKPVTSVPMALPQGTATAPDVQPTKIRTYVSERPSTPNPTKIRTYANLSASSERGTSERRSASVGSGRRFFSQRGTSVLNNCVALQTESRAGRAMQQNEVTEPQRRSLSASTIGGTAKRSFPQKYAPSRLW